MGNVLCINVFLEAAPSGPPCPAVRGFAWELYNVKVHKVLFSRDFSVAISIVKHTLSVNMIPNPILVDKTKKHWQYQQNPIFRVGEPRQKLKANLRCFYAIAWSVELRGPFQRSWGVSTPDPIISVRGMTPRAYQGPKKKRKTSSDLPSIFTEVCKLKIPFFRDPALREIQIRGPWGL